MPTKLITIIICMLFLFGCTPTMESGNVKEDEINEENKYVMEVKEHAKKVYADQQIANGYWLNRLVDAQFYGKDSQANYLRDLEKITAKDIQKVAKTLLNSPNLKEIIQVGVSK